MAAKPFPILCFLPSRPTDAILASGVVKRLHDEIPHAAFTIVAGPRSQPLFRDVPGLRRRLEYPAAGLAAGMKLWSQLRGKRWGLILDTVGVPASRYLGAERRTVKPETLDPEHLVLQAARLLKLEDDPPAPFLFTGREIESLADTLVADDGRPILALGPGGGWIGKRWPAERFSFTVAQLTGEAGPLRGARVMVVGGGGDARVSEPIRRALPPSRLIDLTGQTDLLLAYACLKRARLFIGNATALMHLAAASGTPTIGLLGPTDDELYRPWGARTVTVRGPRSFEEVKRSDPQLNQPVCHMFDVPVEAVVRTATRLLRDTDGATHPAHG
jgi:ADP-heptose:LPS heptosyltransferase